MWKAVSPQAPGISKKAIIPEPMMALMPIAVDEFGASSVERAPLIVETVLMIISGAADPNAMKVAPATSSRTPHLAQHGSHGFGRD